MNHIRVYAVSPAGPQPVPLSAESLDAASLQLPEGVYTTLRTYQHNRIVGLAAHLQRLAESQALLARGRPADAAALRAGLRAVLRQEPHPAARLRLTVPFEGEALYISLEPFAPYPETYYTHGVACATRRLPRPAPRAKHTAFIAAARAVRAQASGAAGLSVHEILRVDEAGHILEGLSSNFFAVLDGALRTAAEGVLLGVTRSAVLAAARDLLPAVEQPVTLADLPRLAEACLTSASREVMPIAAIDATPLPVGPITRELLRRYRAEVEAAAEVV